MTSESESHGKARFFEIVAKRQRLLNLALLQRNAMWKTLSWVMAVAIGISLFLKDGKGDFVEPVNAVVAVENGNARKATGGEVELTRAADGHFYVDAEVNGVPIRFLVDTGATSVALTTGDAEAIGLSFSDEEFTQTGRGVGGQIALKPVQLDSLGVGDMSITNVDAVIAQSQLDISLLGQTWLSRVGTVSIEGDKMILR